VAGPRLAFGVQPAAAEQWFKAGKADVLPALPANPGAQEFISPFQRLSGAGNGCIGL